MTLLLQLTVMNKNASDVINTIDFLRVDSKINITSPQKNDYCQRNFIRPKNATNIKTDPFFYMAWV